MTDKIAVKVDRFTKLDGSGPTKAFCDIVLFDTFVVKGLRVVEGKNGRFLSMPSEQGRDGKWYDTFHPITKEAHKGLQDFVLTQYKGQE